MKNLKKVLALVLVVATLLTMTTIAGATFTDASSIDKTEAVDVLSSLGILNGFTDGSFKPEGNVTRAQMAKMVTILVSSGEDVGSLYEGANVFSDCTTNWAKGYIAYANKMGIVAGVGGGKFNPNGNVTGAQAAKMMLVALGYKSDIEQYTGSQWSVNVLADARDAGLLEGLEDVNMNAALTRENAAQMMLNTLEATLVQYEGGTNITTGDGTSIVVDAKREYVGSENEIAANSYKNPTQTPYTQFCEKYFSKLTLATISGGDDFGRPAQKWTYNGKAVGTYVNIEPVATWTTGIEDITDGDLYKALGFSATTSVKVYENGTDRSSNISVTKGGATKSLTAYKGATIEAYDTTGDNVADSLIVSYPYVAQVTKVTEATASADRKVTMTVWNQASGAALTGVTYETNDFAKDDYVLVYLDGTIATTGAMSVATTVSNAILKVEAANVVTGKISSVSGANGSAVTALTVDGTKYTVADDKLATNGLNDSELVSDGNYGFNGNYTLILSNGYVLAAEGDSVAAQISNIVYVTAPAFKQTDDYGTGTYYVQTIKLDGTVENVKISDQTDGKDNQSPTAQAFVAGFYTKTQNATDSTLWDLVPVAAANTIDNSTVYYGIDTTDGAQSMKEDSTTLALTTTTKGYLTANTRVIFVDGSLGSLTTSMVTGPIKQSIATGANVLVSQDKDGNKVIEAVIVAAKKVNVSDEVVYLDPTAQGVNANGTEYNMYNIATGEKTLITADSTNVSSNSGFATYSIDEKGVYSFSKVNVTTTKNEDGSHAITQAITKYQTLLTEGTTLVDIEAKNAVIINNTGVAANDGLTLDDIANATALTGFAYVTDEAVTCIVVNTITKAV